MREVGVLEAKTQLSALLAEVERTGEPILITRHGRAVARLSAEPVRRRFTPADAENLIRWRETLAREHPASTEPFDWKAAVEEGRE